MLFQNCGAHNYVAGGNGDPHEGIDGGDSVVVVNPPNTPTNPPDGDISYNPGIPTPPEWLCNMNSRDIHTLEFRVDRGEPTIKVATYNGTPYHFFWDKNSVQALHEIYTPISNSIILETIYFDQMNGEVVANYFMNDKAYTLEGQCKKK